MPSPPGPTSASCSATSTAAVADVSTRTGRPPQNCDRSRSKFSTQGPLAICPERKTSATPAIVSSSRYGAANLSGGPILGARDEPDADDDEPDAEPSRDRDALTQQIVCSD